MGLELRFPQFVVLIESALFQNKCVFTKTYNNMPAMEEFLMSRTPLYVWVQVQQQLLQI